jgi:hypothetical protein
MSYVESGAPTSTRRARRRRALITMGVVALLLFFAFWYAYSYYSASGKPTAIPTATCTRTTAPTPATVTVNVYNATDRNGLAAKTAAEVRRRGFKVATVANDPLQRTVAGTAEVRYGPSGAAGGKLVLALVRGAKAHPDGRTDASVDLVLGNKFTALAVVPKAKPAPKPIPKPSTTTTKPAATPTRKPTATPTTPRTTAGC